MADQDKLTIHKLTFNIEVADKDAFKFFADKISNLCKRTLPQRLDKVLTKHNLPKGTLKIRKMNIDVGRIPQHHFERTILNTIATEFDSFLTKNIAKIEEELKQAKFQYHHGNSFYIDKSEFYFESDLVFKDTVLIGDEFKKTNETISTQALKEITKKSGATFSITKALDPLQALDQVQSIDDGLLTDLSKIIAQSKGAAGKTVKINLPDHEEINLGSELEKTTEKGKHETEISEKEQALQNVLIQLEKIQKLDSNAMLRAIKAMESIPPDLPAKKLTELDKAFLYYLKYGRLPSNVKYELDMSMLEIFNVNQKDIRFFQEVKKQIAKDDRAKERLLRLADESNQTSLIKKNILAFKDTEDFDVKIPKAFEDYFVALVLKLDLSTFTPEMRRYNLNDMIRFFYADHPQKLRAIITFLLIEYPSKSSTKKRIKDLFKVIGKSSIVKIMASFVRKAGYVNKYLNQLNKVNERDIKEAHASVLFALLKTKDPIKQLRKDKFKIEEAFEIAPRIFFKAEPLFELIDYQRHEIIDYYLTYGSIPFASAKQIWGIDQISVFILGLNAQQIKNLNYFKEKKFKSNYQFETLGRLPINIVNHLIKSLKPEMADETTTKYQYFKYHIKSGVSEPFQTAFLLYYVLLESPKSYLEEMITFWKKQYGDDEKIIRRRWKVSEELEKELVTIIKIKEETVEDLLKVDPEYQSYSKDISVKNAGLVILWPFLKIYFNMLDLLNSDGDFRSINERARACHLLQYLAVKQAGGDELYYPLNKILTGYPLDEPLPYEITMTDKEIDVSNALLKNVIKQWNALKGGSVDALRGSFLIRDGVIAPAPNGWLLTVENKSYDILMDKLPWGIGMIKLSWAPYVLSVEWERNIM